MRPSSPSPEPRLPQMRLIIRWAIPILLTSAALGTTLWLTMGLDKYVDFSLDRWFDPTFFAVVMGILLFGQCLLLSGAPNWTPHRARRRRSVWISFAAGALIAAFLTFGIAAALLSIGSVWQDITKQMDSLWPFVGIVVILWGGWLLLFTMMFVGQWVAIFPRIYRLLIAGTALELLITIPIDVHVRKRTDCYCGEGSFFALSIGIGSTFLLFGPGMVMLLLTRYAARRDLFRFCRGCGYDLRLNPADRCPECGRPVKNLGASNPTNQPSSL